LFADAQALLFIFVPALLLLLLQDKLDYVLALTPQDFLERRLQTLVFKQGLAKSIHHARVLIRQRHIRCGSSSSSMNSGSSSMNSGSSSMNSGSSSSWAAGQQGGAPAD
jgi:uncharacterized membrane protein YgcG